ncbi:MAG: hypothetical protein KF788_13670 [Piscinibacter sp.]|nr:hypothetical protein [Piscinibacter sp.]
MKKRTHLSICVAGALMAGTLWHGAAAAVQTSVRVKSLEFRSDAGDDHLNLEAQLSTSWGRAGARLLAARDAGGALDGTTRAWWKSDLPDLGSSLRLGSQQAAATLLRSAVDLTGLGLAGRWAPAVLDYALSVGRLDDSAGGLPAAAAWLKRRLGQGALALHALQVGRAYEVGAALDTPGAWPGGRWGLVQYADPDAAQTRVVGTQRLALRGATLQARADRVVSGCAVPAGIALALPGVPTGCLSVDAGAAVDLLPRWQMLLGSSYQMRPDDSSARQLSLGAVWQSRPGMRLSVTLQRGDGDGAQTIGASLSYPLGLPF